MKYILVFSILLSLICSTPDNKNNRNIITKNNGDIILAYKGFEKFLNSEKTWNEYENYVLDEFATLNSIHNRCLHYGFIDSLLFKKEVSDYSIIDFDVYFNNISEEKIENLYDSVITEMDKILAPLGNVDFCLFLPYVKDCFVQKVNGKQTIFISIKYNIEEMDLILIHEYAHCLHHQRRPDEASILKKWIVSEGIASFFPIILSENCSIYDGLWMMPKENIDWCMKNERQIIDSIFLDIEKNGLEISKKYIAGGEGFATPPIGFPEKTGYYIGYRIIERCLAKGISLTELCSIDSETITDISEIF